LALAKDQLQEDDTLLLESDLIFEDSLLQKILLHDYPNLALVSKYETWNDGTVVRIDADNTIVSFIPKKEFRFSDVNEYYKTVNIYKFSKEFSKSHYVPFLEAYCKAMGDNEYYEQVLRVITMLDKVEFKALPLDGEKWYEIDDIQDLDIAESIFAEGSLKLEKFQKRYGGYWRFPHLLDFCYLVNPYFPTARMKDEIKANFDILMTEYPSGMFVNSMLMAKYFVLKQDYVCVGNGAAELIKSLVEHTEGNIGVVFPTFEEYPNRKNRSEVISYIPSNKDFSYTVPDLTSFFGDKNISTLLLINPDNPSGNYIGNDELLTLIAWAKERNIRMVVDESFADFSDSYATNSLLQNKTLETYPNLIVIKSISKSYGVPGLRLGVLASSDKDFIAWMKRDIAIWNINSFAEFYLQIFSKYEDNYKKACEKFVVERNRFFSELQEIPFLRVIPSQANYFLCEVTDKYSSTSLTELLLVKNNILIKDCGSKSAFASADYIRIAVRDEKDNNTLINVLKQL
jgi:histidinol-phosphate/aromatic aminotransferase/cobyric acid decarboxylase-like protein